MDERNKWVSSDLYLIDGYFNDDKSEFYNYIVCEFDGLPSNDLGVTDEDIFFYGLSRRVAEELIGDPGVDFTITAVRSI